MQDIKSVYRPPIEEDTPVLQVTLGCSHNKCKFCGMYKSQPFKVVETDDIELSLIKLAEGKAEIKRLYLSSGDAFALAYDKLESIAMRIKHHLPMVSTIAMFSSIDNISRKSDKELTALRHMGMNEITIGFESGWDDVLKRMDKGHTSHDVIEQCGRLDAAGIDYYFSVIVGIAGNMLGHENASITAEILNRTAPKRIDIAGLTVFPNSELSDMVKRGAFIEARECDMVQEIISLVEKLTIDTYFDATHCTVPIRVSGMLPEHKEQILKALDKGLEGFDERRHRRRRERYMKLRR